VIKSSQQYYRNRDDLKNISFNERESLTLWHARLTCVEQWLKDGTLPFRDFYTTIIQSNKRIITDENTKLHIDSGRGNFSNITVNPNIIEFWTTQGNPNIILENYSVSDVQMQWGELSVTVSWDMYETVVTDQTAKQQLDANLSPRDGKTPGTWTVKVRLMLAK
jgi:hypothetical protein